MPSKYVIRSFVEKGFYHIFNRGIGKNTIFHESQDYEIFLRYLFGAIIPRDTFDYSGHFHRKNFYEKIKLSAYCIMPNHFHLLIQQITDRDLPKFMQSIIAAYTLYYNKKYEHCGPIFQGRYKAKIVDKDEYLLHLTRYIHLNPEDLGENPLLYPHSSIKNYIAIDDDRIDRQLIFDLLGAKNHKEGFEKYRKFFQSTQKEIRPMKGFDL